MSLQVTTGAMLMCSFGVAPSVLNVLPLNRVLAGGMPAANIMDFKPFLNIPPFTLCRSMANPVVAKANPGFPYGTFKPQPCTPIIPAPWIPGSPTVLIGNIPAVSNNCKVMCAYAGIIQVILPGQFQTMVP